jgi:hypothetical protein
MEPGFGASGVRVHFTRPQARAASRRGRRNRRKANKDFDLLMLPNQGHGYGNASNYMTRRRWDYFVRYLLGAEPPHGYELHPPMEPRTP